MIQRGSVVKGGHIGWIQDVHQLSDEEKDAVPEDVKRAAREMVYVHLSSGEDLLWGRL